MTLARPSQQRPVAAIAFAEHHAFVRRRLRGLGVQDADLDDAAQDVFEVLVRRIADYDESRPLRGWMAGIARNVARRYRERGQRKVLPMEEERAATGESPEQQLATGQARALLQEFLAELDADRWAVFVLSEVEGLRGSEIAAELGVNQNTVYARLRSARTAFERRVRRHHARERRVAWAVLPTWLGGGRRPGWLVPLIGTIGLASMLGIGVALGRCNATARDRANEATTGASPAGEATPAPGVGERQVDSAVASAPGSPPGREKAPDADGWYGLGSGYASSEGADGTGHTLSHEGRYRLEGHRLTLEMTYIGDDDVDVEDAASALVLDGLEVVDGSEHWVVAVPAGQTRIVTTTLRATRPGQVQVEVVNGRSGTSSSRLSLIEENAGLRRCGDDECEAPTADEGEALSGTRITVNVLNECRVDKQFVLYAGYPEHKPPPDIRVHTLEPGEQRRMTIDAAQWFLDRHPDGCIHGGVQIDSDGAWVKFSGEGDECNSASASSPGMEDL